MMQQLLLLIIVLCSLIYFFSNMSADLTRAGEARAAEIAREMLDRGNFILPSINHQISADTLTKPPLYHWMLIAAGAPFDWQNWAMRMVSVASGLGSIWLVFLFGRRMFGFRAAVFSVLVLSTSIVFLENSSAARMDGFFSFLILASVYCFWMVINRPHESGWIYGFYALSAMAVLTKGPVGVLLPLVVASILVLSSTHKHSWRSLAPPKAVLLFFAIVLPWYVLLVITAPPGLASNFLFGQLAQWWAGSANMAAKGGQPVTYYLPHIVIGLFPWSLFLPAAIILGIRAARQENSADIKSMLIWFLGGFILFSLGGKKATRYLLPIMAPFALIMGFYWERLGEQISNRHGKVLVVSAVLVFVLVMVLVLLCIGIYADIDWVMQWLFHGRSRGGESQLAAGLDLFLQHPFSVGVAIAAVVVSALIAMFGSMQRNRYLLVFGLAAIVWSTVWPFTMAVRPVLKKQLSPRAAVETIAGMLPRDAILYGGGNGYEHAVRWYLQRDIQVESRTQLYNRVRQQPSSWVLLLERKSPQDLFLVTNRKRLEWHIDYYYMTLFPGTQQ